MEATQVTTVGEDSKSYDDQEMIESMVYSGIESLATSDDSLSQSEESQLVIIAEGKLEKKENPGKKIGKYLAGVADEIDTNLTSNRVVDKIVESVEPTELLKQYFMEAAKQIIGPDGDITAGRMLMIVMLGYGVIKKYLKLLVGDSIMGFIEKTVKVIYEVFKNFGIFKWIVTNGGWEALAMIRMDTKIIHEIYSGLTSGVWGVLGAGAAVVAGFCVYKAATTTV